MTEQKLSYRNQMEALTKTFTEQIDTLKGEMLAMTKQIHTQVSSIRASGPSPSYAEVARTPPSSQASNIRALTSMGNSPSTMADTLYCTVDTSRVGDKERDKVQPGAIRKAIEDEMHTIDGLDKWRCTAVIRDARNTERIRVVCRDEAELQRVNEAAKKTVVRGARVMKDRLYPVKVDRAKRAAVVDHEGNILPGAAEVLGKENEVNIAKLWWLSRRDSGTYGSIVVLLTKASDAKRRLQEQYFHVAGESGSTGVYEPRYGPKQCYRCQELGHRVFSCTSANLCKMRSDGTPSQRMSSGDTKVRPMWRTA